MLSEFGKRAHLPQDKTVPVEIMPNKPGEYEFICGINMYKGRITIQ